MNKAELKKLIPHREPMLLIDEAFVDAEGKAKGSYTVLGEEFFLQGHFPNNPVVPGVILCEMMAQVCCVLILADAVGKTPYFTGLNKVKFKHPVKPQDKIEFICEVTGSKGAFYFARGKGFVGGRLCVEGEFSFALIDPQ